MEKLLTNWLSLCMYDYLKKHVATAMFMLYKAIKHQTEKGPVDAVTSDARYALSEDRLLRENTECRPLVERISLPLLRRVTNVNPDADHYPNRQLILLPSLYVYVAVAIAECPHWPVLSVSLATYVNLY